MLGTTVNATALLGSPLTVTTTGPDRAATGTGTVILETLHVVGVAMAPSNDTVLVPWFAPKFEPPIVTAVLTGPTLGNRLEMTGGTVNAIPLLARPRTVTTTGPVVAAAGTIAVMFVALHAVTAAATPLNTTVPVP